MTTPIADAPPPPEVPAPRPPRAGGGIGRAALIVGIVAVVLALIPFASYGAGLPAIVALVLGIVAVARAGDRPKTAGIVGLILGILALILAVVMSVVYTIVFVLSAVQSQGIGVLSGGGLPSGFPSDLASAFPSGLPTDLPTPSDLSDAPTEGTGGTITYSLTGSGRATDVSYLAISGDSFGADQVDATSLPWTKRIGFAKGASTSGLTLLATLDGKGSLTCSIAVNGKVVSTRTTSTDGDLVECSSAG